MAHVLSRIPGLNPHDTQPQMSDITAKLGQKVRIAVKALLDDGSVALQASKDKPLKFILDPSNTIPGFAKAIIGMAPDETKKVTLPPQEAFGVYDPENTVQVDNRELDRMPNCKVGDRIILQGPSTYTKPIMGWIEKLDAKGATISRNHPLAGKTIHVTVTLMAVS